MKTIELELSGETVGVMVRRWLVVSVSVLAWTILSAQLALFLAGNKPCEHSEVAK